jgi:hypothetical protein
MAESSGFFPDVSGDRSYTSDWLAKYIASIVGNGTYDGELGVTADGSTMSVTLPVGRAWINGYLYRNDGPLTLVVDNADGVLNRIDIIVLRWDINARSITAQVIKGTPASSATVSAITRSAEQYDLKLAEISIPAGTTAITQSLITDCRLNKSVCGIVTGAITQVDTTTFYNQIQTDLANFKSNNEAGFTSWVNGLKTILDENAAGHLQNEIDEGVIHTYTHAKAGTVHALTGSGSNGKFLATADFAEGDTFTVNGTAIPAMLQNGEALSDEFFKSGNWVNFTFDGTKLGFKTGGSSAVEVFGFHLYGKSDNPTNPVAGDIWIKAHDISEFTNVVLDDAVRLTYTNQYLMLVVDDTNNGSDTITQPKKSASGAKVTFTSVRDTANDSTLPWQVSNINKSGNIFDIKRKYPLVYSRLNDVLDMETAYVYDGSAWQMISQNGSYLLQGCSSAAYTNAFNRIDTTLSLHSNFPIKAYCCGITHSYEDIFMAHLDQATPKLTGCRRSGDTFTSLDIASALPSNINLQRVGSIAISHDGNYLAVGCLWYSSQYFVGVIILQKQSDKSWKYVDYIYCYSGQSAWDGENVPSVDWSPDDSHLAYVALCESNSCYLCYYKRTDDYSFTCTWKDNSRIYQQCTFSPDGKHLLATTTERDNYIINFNILSDTALSGKAFPSLGSQLPASLKPIFFPNTNTFLASNSNSMPVIYKIMDDGTICQVSYFETGNKILCVAVSFDGKYAAFGFGTPPYIALYSFSTDGQYTSTQLPAPPTGSEGSQVNALDFIN